MHRPGTVAAPAKAGASCCLGCHLIRFFFIAAFGVLIAAGTHLLIGMALAFGFRRDALDAGPRTRDWGVWVRSVTNDQIVITARAATQNLGHPGTVGLFWENGYGLVGEVRHVDALDVTRSFEMVTGEKPPVCADPLDDCEQVDLDGYAFPSDPSNRGLEFTEVSFSAPLGELGAWHIDAGPTWAIHVHGWKAERREALRMLPAYDSEEISSLVIDYRCDPGAPLDSTGRHRIGLSEWEDLEAAVEYALGRGASRIILSGFSTGCAVIMAFLERSQLSDEVVGLVFDAPNIIWADVVRANTADLKLPVLGIKASTLMKETGMWLADLMWKIDWEATNYVQRAAQTVQVPTLVFHGTSDKSVPIAVSRQLEAAVPEHVELVETPAAGHVMSWNADPDGYERRLEGFLSRL